MKILKNIFGSKTKQNTKYEPNTLAEMNGSPDLRLATAKEKEVDIPLPKNEEVTKIPKKSARSAASKTVAGAEKSSQTSKSKVVKDEQEKKGKEASVKKSTAKPTVTDAESKVDSPKKTASKSTSNTKETTVKSNTKKASEPKKSASAPAKKVEATTKTGATKSTKSPATKPAAKPVEAKETKVTAKSTAKKTTSPEKKATDEKKSAAAPAKKQATTKTTAPASPKASKSPEKSTKTATKKAVENNDSDVITESKVTRSGKFEIKKSKDGRFVFNLYASNNVIVATSQIYSSSTSAVNGIKSVIANAASAQIEDQSLKKVTPVPFPKWEIYQDKGEQYRFRLCASNGSCVVHSQGYTSKANCKKGIESIIKFASDAEITKVYLDKK